MNPVLVLIILGTFMVTQLPHNKVWPLIRYVHLDLKFLRLSYYRLNFLELLSESNEQGVILVFLKCPMWRPSIKKSVYQLTLNMPKDCLFFWNPEKFMYTTCSEHGIFMSWTRNSMNNLPSHFGLVDARISASDKYLLVVLWFVEKFIKNFNLSYLHCLSGSQTGVLVYEN